MHLSGPKVQSSTTVRQTRSGSIHRRFYFMPEHGCNAVISLRLCSLIVQQLSSVYPNIKPHHMNESILRNQNASSSPNIPSRFNQSTISSHIFFCTFNPSSLLIQAASLPILHSLRYAPWLSSPLASTASTIHRAPAETERPKIAPTRAFT